MRWLIIAHLMLGRRRGSSRLDLEGVQQFHPQRPSRWELLSRDYEMLREDDRSFITVMVAMASVIALVGGTSVFFLLHGCGIGGTRGCSDYPWQVYALLPAPTVAICALLVQQATAATFRGRLMLALEEALVAEAREEYLLGKSKVPAFTSYHFQHPVIQGVRGAALWATMFILPFVLVLGLIFYSGQRISSPGEWLFYATYTGLLLLMAWGGSPTLHGYPSLDDWLPRYLDHQRERGRFRL